VFFSRAPGPPSNTQSPNCTPIDRLPRPGVYLGRIADFPPLDGAGRFRAVRVAGRDGRQRAQTVLRPAQTERRDLRKSSPSSLCIRTNSLYNESPGDAATTRALSRSIARS
jgi:hypothetical protein